MEFIITESQLLRLIKESKKVVCDECGWSWKLSEGGDDPYKCHKCGHQNKSPKKREEKEGAGAYDAPAFEMDADHVHFKHQYNEGELTERCWKGYTQKGMKTMFGKRYPNCVKSKK